MTLVKVESISISSKSCLKVNVKKLMALDFNLSNSYDEFSHLRLVVQITSNFRPLGG
jgi:hypothetical protein